MVRYRLAPTSGHAPQVYLRGSVALEGRPEREVALGVSARPFAGVPVRLAAEARVREADSGIEARSAAYAVTELAPVRLPGGLTGEAYLQGGYVTGDFATPFVDGQARITRTLAGDDDFRLEAGGGAWGGAQQDAQRLDVGPERRCQLPRWARRTGGFPPITASAWRAMPHLRAALRSHFLPVFSAQAAIRLHNRAWLR